MWIHFHLFLLCLLHLPLLFHHVKLVCGCHHGQFWLLNSRFFHLGFSSLGRIYFNLVRLWCKWHVSIICLHFYASKTWLKLVAIVDDLMINLKPFIWNFSGKIHYTDVFNMLRQIDPPLGFGKKCPERMAYKKLIRMNMPMDKEGKVSNNDFWNMFKFQNNFTVLPNHQKRLVSF